MKLALRSVLSLTLVALGAPSLVSQCLGGTQPCVTIAQGDVSDLAGGGPFVSGTTYVLTGPITVPTGQTLTIQPGAVIKPMPNFTLANTITIRGTLLAQGTLGQPIIFTSYFDDSAGGDTNGGGGAPNPGDLKSIDFVPNSGQPTPSALSHCVFRYGGGIAGGSSPRPQVVANNNLAIDNCEFAFSAGDGIQLVQSANPSITNCDFHDMQRAFTGVSMSGVSLLSGNTASNMVLGNDRLDLQGGSSGINVVGPTTWTPANTLNNSGVLVPRVTIGIPSSASLTLAAGMTIKFAQSNLGVNIAGALTANGTGGSPVVFTALNDTQFAGSVNGGAPAAPGDWVGLQFLNGSTGSVLTQARVRYAGNLSGAGVRITSADATLDSVEVEFSSGAGLTADNSSPTVTNCSFDNNLRAIGQLPITAIPSFVGNTAANNTQSDALSIGGGTLSTSLTLGPQNLLGGGAFVLAGSFTVGLAGALTLQADTIIKAESGFEIVVDGTLTTQGTPSMPVIFTSIDDDTAGGDTNKNGSSTTGAPGNWMGLELKSGSGASMLSNTVVRFGGNSGAPGIALIASSATLNGVTVEECSNTGLSLTGGAAVTLSGCAFDNNGGAAIGGTRIGQLAGFTNCTAQGNVGGNDIRIGGTTLNSSLTLDPVNTLNQSGVIVFTGNLTVSQLADLTLQPNLALKFDGIRDFDVFGSLLCPVGPVWITSVLDDLTPGGGSAQPGDWGKMALNGAGSSLVGVEIRYLGGSGRGLVLGNDDNTLQQCRISRSAVEAVEFAIDGTPTLTDCSFDQNARIFDTLTSFENLKNVTGSVGSGNAAGDFVEVFAAGGLTPIAAPRMGLNGTGVLVVGANVQNSSGQILTIEQGTILKFRPGLAMFLQDALFCTGTMAEPVVMTSFQDDAFGGDTNGTPQAPTPGDWQGLSFGSGSDASVVEETIIRYAGANGMASIELQSADITLKNVTIENGAGPGIDLNGTSAPTIMGGSISNNGGSAVAGMTWGGLGNISGVQTMGNVGDTFTQIDSPTVAGDVVIYPHSYFGDSLVVTVSPSMFAGASITFMPGCVVKAGTSSVEFDFLGSGGGVLGTARDPVVFTSIHDDEFGGSVLGGVQAPSSGDWLGVEVGGPMRHALVRYAGAGGVPGLKTGLGTVEGCRVEFAANDGFELGTTQFVAGRADIWNCVAFANGGDGFDILGRADLRWCTSASNAGFGITGGTIAITVQMSNSWANGIANFPALAPEYRSFSSSPGWNVHFCNGISGFGSCPPPVPMFGICAQSGVQNTNVAPQFVDLANGDLRLASASPLIGTVPSAGVFPTSPQSSLVFDAANRANEIGAADADDNPRILDHDLGGPAPFRADVGAFERAAFRLGVAGDAQRGTDLVLTASGASGVFAPHFGFRQDAIAPFVFQDLGGSWFLGDPALVLVAGSLPTGGSLNVPVPSVETLVGVSFVIQAVVVPSSGGAIALTNGQLLEIY